MKSNRVITIVVILGVVIAGVTFLGAAHMLGDDSPSTKDTPRIIGPVKSGSNGVVVFGNVDQLNGVPYLAIYPENLPQPSVVTKVYKVEGDIVRPNDVLFELDPKLADIKVEEAQKALDKASAALQGAQAQLEQANLSDRMHKIAIEAQRETLNANQSKIKAAEIELNDKQEKAKRIGAPNDPELLAAKENLASAKHQFESEKKKLEALELGNPNPLMSIKRAEAGVSVAKADIAIQEALLNEAKYGRSLMTVKAHVGGKIVRSQVTEGTTFGMQTRQPALLLQPAGTLIVRAEVDQEFASRVAVGQTAVIHDDGNPNLKWTGKVLRVSDAFLPKRANPTSPEGLMLNDSRVLECIVSVEGGDPNFPIRVGQRVKVGIGVE